MQSDEKNVWEDKVFISRQREFHRLAQEFEESVDNMLGTETPVITSSMFNEEETEEEEEEEVFESYSAQINGSTLLIIHEIDQLKRSAHKVSQMFNSRALKRNPQYKNIFDGLLSLIEFLDGLRIRAEKLIQVEETDYTFE